MENSLVMKQKSVMFKKEDVMHAGLLAAVLMLAFVLSVNFGFASATSSINEMLGTLIGVIGIIFRAVGIILAAYAIGTLVLAFKNEDADSKSRAATMLVVAVVLIALPSVLEGLDIFTDNNITINTNGI